MIGVGLAIADIPGSKENSFDLSAGIIYQEATRLAGGLKEGSSLAKDADLKTTEEFEAGLYIQAGFKF